MTKSLILTRIVPARLGVLCMKKSTHSKQRRLLARLSSINLLCSSFSIVSVLLHIQLSILCTYSIEPWARISCFPCSRRIFSLFCSQTHIPVVSILFLIFVLFHFCSLSSCVFTFIFSSFSLTFFLLRANKFSKDQN